MSEISSSSFRPGLSRPRRLRLTPALRRLARETHLTPADFIYPLFITNSQGRTPIPSLPGISRLGIDAAVEEAVGVSALGVGAVILFGLPATKDPIGRENFDPNGIVQRAVRALKSVLPQLVVVTDVCLCEYTDHGHCGVLNSGGNRRPQPYLPENYVLNDETLPILGQVALSHAAAGADIVAPSGMLDGMVGAIRHKLDDGGYQHLPILSYAVKYASAFYGPFRDAAGGGPRSGDRKSHQMDPANAREALREAVLDVAEGADLLMVKPALAYLDVVRRVRRRYPEFPLVAYNVSGEYAMLKAAVANGWLDERAAVLEMLTGIKRAGADLIITYHAKEAAQWLSET